MQNEEKSNKEKLLSQLRSIENKLWLARLDELLSEYEVIDLKIKIIDLKIKLLNDGKDKTNDIRQT